MGLETELVAEDVEIDLPDLKFTYQENSVEHFQEELSKEDGTKLDVILEVMKSKLLQLNTPGFISLESKPLFKSLLLEKQKEVSQKSDLTQARFHNHPIMEVTDIQQNSLYKIIINSIIPIKEEDNGGEHFSQNNIPSKE